MFPASRIAGALAVTLTAAVLLTGCVAGAVFPIPTGSNSSAKQSDERK